MSSPRDPAQFPLPRPTPHVRCFKCNTDSLGALICGQGGGKILGNWGRWMQRCAHCGDFVYHGPPTPLEFIPSTVSERFYQDKVNSESDTDSSIYCTNKHCTTAKTGKARRANKACPSLRCSKCCMDNGGCDIHRSANSQPDPISQTNTRDPLPSTPPSSQTEPSTTRGRSFARAVDEDYGFAYVDRHKHTFNANNIVAQQRQIVELANNTITSVLWTMAGVAPLRLKVAAISGYVVYACEIHDIMSAISHLKGDNAIAGAVAASGLTIGRTAFFKHRALYNEARDAGILTSAVEEGMSPAGRWSDVIKAVMTLRNVASPRSRPTSSVLAATRAEMLGNDDDLEYKVMEGRIEEYRLDSEGLMTSFYPPERDNLQFIYLAEPAIVGARKDVHFGFFSIENKQISIAIKILKRPSDPWASKYSSKHEGMWIECARLFSGLDHARNFIQQAHNMNITIYSICVLTPYILLCGGSVHMAQDWAYGVPHHKFPVSQLCEDTLNALSHYIYHMTDHLETCVDYQGLRFGNTLNIFNFRTHRADDNDKRPLLDNEGYHGLTIFTMQHNCNDICTSFGLPPTYHSASVFSSSSTSSLTTSSSSSTASSSAAASS
ncbi:hypothetical protein EYR40_002106 [Pleurotus pulmonarius]|nr:hypothetical protein EYR40_002106 [Pleurotus pulmonarius]